MFFIREIRVMSRKHTQANSSLQDTPTDTESLSQYVTTLQAAEMLGVTRFQVIHLLTIKKITGIKWARDWLIYAPSVQKYLETKSRRGRPSSKTPKLLVTK